MLALGCQADNGAGWIEKSGVMLVTVDHGKSPEGLWNLRPEYHGDGAAMLQYAASLSVVVGMCGEGEVVVCRPIGTLEESVHPCRDLRVVEEANLGKAAEDVGMKQFPSQVA